MPLPSVKTTLLAAALCVLAAPAWSLDILVGNDDSCTSEGVNAIMDALEAAGHNAVMYAPAGEQSGKSSSISTNVFTAYDISNVGFAGPTGAANRFCVRIPTESPEEGADEELIASASPRDSVMVGLAALGDKVPDLVVTGINDGQNIGSGAITSGTVGAAAAAILQGIPAIAISRHRFATAEGMSYQQGAQLLVAIIAELEANRAEGESLLPALTGLNVNTPEGTPRGIVHTTLGTQTDLKLYPTADDGRVILGFNGILSLAELLEDEAAAEELSNNPDATIADFEAAGLDTGDETSMFVAGYITITTLDADLTAGLRKRELLQLKLRNLDAGE